MKSQSTSTSLGDLVAARPKAIRTLQRYGIDWCCNPESLDQACKDRGIEIEEILAEIRRDEEATAPGPAHQTETVAELMDRIVKQYHEPLYLELQRINALARKVVDAHEVRHGEQLWATLRTFESLRESLERHMAQEEEALFPWLLGGSRKDLDSRLAPVELEHASETFLIRRLRTLSDDYTPPSDACATWTALFVALQDLEASLLEHARLEDEVLFPRIRQEAGVLTPVR